MVGCATLAAGGFMALVCLKLQEAADAVYPGALAILAGIAVVLGVVALVGGLMYGVGSGLRRALEVLMDPFVQLPIEVGQLQLEQEAW